MLRAMPVPFSRAVRVSLSTSQNVTFPVARLPPAVIIALLFGEKVTELTDSCWSHNESLSVSAARVGSTTDPKSANDKTKRLTVMMDSFHKDEKDERKH